MQRAVGGLEALHGLDAAGLHGVGEHRAAVGGDVVHQHGAGTALAPVAAQFGAGEPQFVAQGVGEGLLGGHIHGAGLAVDAKADGALHKASRPVAAAASGTALAGLARLPVGRIPQPTGSSHRARGDDPFDKAPACEFLIHDFSDLSLRLGVLGGD